MKWTALLTTLVAAAILSGCGEKPEDRQIASGLACLDAAATSADADVCLDKVQGLETSQAYLIRCSANFIAQGFTGSRVASAFQKMKDNAAGTNASSQMESYFVFRSDGIYARHTSAITYANCDRSGVQSMKGLATLVNVASTVAGTITPGSNLDPNSPTFDPAALKQKFADAYTSNDAATNLSIGTSAISAQSIYCVDGSSLKDQDICTKITSAVNSGNGNTASVGRALLGLLQQ